jgi:membrane-associated protein
VRARRAVSVIGSRARARSFPGVPFPDERGPMDVIHTVLDYFLHLDDHLAEMLGRYGSWTYLLLFAIVFAETGLVVTPFLPGDSLLFTAGTLASRVEGLSVGLLFLLLSAAAILGDTVNYAIGNLFGRQLLARGRLINPRHVERTHEFFEKYGGKTFAPFVAGLGAMTYGRFVLYNVTGGIAWVAICLFAGFFFGRIPAVQEHFELVVLGIIFVSVLPAAFEVLKARAERTRSAGSDA